MIVKTPAIDGDLRDMLALAKRQVETAIDALDQSAQRLQSCRSEAAADIRKDARLLNGAIQMLTSEKTKIENSIKELDGIEAGYALDLDAAREEIRYRLDRLRAARAAGELSE